ncbi:MAG: hypothetical protein AAFV72_24785 [Cyanobacteria bacterium J06635_1]
MAKVQIKSEIDINQVLDGIAQLETSELERFLTKVSLILAQRKESGLPASEADLLQKINQGLPPETQQRHDELYAKLHSQIITPEEHQELLKLIDVIEQADAERLQHLIALSQLRQLPLDELMNQLEIPHPPVHV